MTDYSDHRPVQLSRRKFLWGATALLAGCTTPALRPDNSDNFEEQLSATKLVRDYAAPFGLHPMKVESAGLVLNLAGTGGDPPPSTERAMIIDEMKKRSVENPNQLLADPSTAIVLARGYLPPGCKKGDRFDIDVWVPPNVETSSIRGGKMLEARLRELAVARGRVREGHTVGLAKGSILVDPLAEQDDSSTMLRRGRIISGGVCLKKRPLGLTLKPESKSVPVSAKMGKAINQRFSAYIGGRKVGVATPKTDGYVELIVHPSYKHNIGRYFQVIRSIALHESGTQRVERMKVLADQLHDPITTTRAALRLEAIGKAAIDTLKTAVEASDAEIRFRACEALAYLDETSAAMPLGKLAREESAFRAGSLAALSAMDDPFARDELEKCLNVQSAETRYGGFRALTLMNDRDPLVRGEKFEGFTLHAIESTAEPLIHLTGSHRPDVVLFNVAGKLRLPVTLEPSHNVMVTSTPEGMLSIARFQIGKDNEKQVVPNQIDSLIRGIVEMGCGYPEVVNMLVQAHRSDALGCRLEIDALPEGGREFVREESSTELS